MTAPEPRIYLNFATDTQLENIDALSSKHVESVKKQRPFKSWGDLSRAGLNEDEIYALKGKVGIDPDYEVLAEPGSGGSAASGAGNMGSA